MKTVDIHGMTNMELVQGGTDEWYWATDYIHGDLYEAEELFRQRHHVRSNRLYLIHLSTIRTVQCMSLCRLWTVNILAIPCMMKALLCCW